MSGRARCRTCCDSASKFKHASLKVSKRCRGTHLALHLVVELSVAPARVLDVPMDTLWRRVTTLHQLRERAAAALVDTPPNLQPAERA